MKIVVLDESATASEVLCAILRRGGFEVASAATADSAQDCIARFAPDPVLLLLSSTLAAAFGDEMKDLLSHRPRPVITLTCTSPATCPLHPGLPCPDLGCLRKPDDMIAGRLISRVREIVAHS